MSFATLKKSAGSIERLVGEIEKLNSPIRERKVDERFWQPEVDKAGNGMAVIRFLPITEADQDGGLPWARTFNHGFKGPTGKWYIENSLTTLNQKDPVSEYNSVLWNAVDDDSSPQRKQARLQKRRLTYVSNIYIITDAKNPKNEGKIFLFKYGKKIFDKIQDAFRPPFDEHGRSAEHPSYDPTNAFDPFDLWKGANFRMRIRTVDNYRNYDASVFDVPAPLNKDDAVLENIWKAQYSLKEFTSPANFKTYDELKKKLHEVLDLNLGSSSHTTQENTTNTTNKSPLPKKSSSKELSTAEDDEDLKQFKALLDD